MAFARLKNLALGGLLLLQLPLIAGQGPPGEGTSSASSGLPPPDTSSSTSGGGLSGPLPQESSSEGGQGGASSTSGYTLPLQEESYSGGEEGSTSSTSGDTESGPPAQEESYSDGGEGSASSTSGYTLPPQEESSSGGGEGSTSSTSGDDAESGPPAQEESYSDGGDGGVSSTSSDTGSGPPAQQESSSGEGEGGTSSTSGGTESGPPGMSSTSSGTESGPLPQESSSDSGAPQEGGNGETDTDISTLPEMCNQAGYDADYDVYLSGSGDDMVKQVFTNTSCANHVNYGVDKGPDLHFPARIYAVNQSIPAFPQLFADGYSTDLSETIGQIGILVNGVPMYSAFAGTPVTDWDSTAMAAEYDTFDACASHSTTEGHYHTHGTPGCLMEQVMKIVGVTYQEHSPFLGWSFDGLPVYGPYGPDGVMMLACGASGADETYCLDDCSGMEAEMPDVDEFKYRYYLTCGFDEGFFPGAVNCFRGCCPDGFECTEAMEACDDGAEAGYTEDYVPETGIVVTEQYDTDFLEGDDRLYINTTTTVNCQAYYNNSEDESLITPTTAPRPGETSLDSGYTYLPEPSSSAERSASDFSSAAPTSSPTPALEGADTSDGSFKRGTVTTATRYVALGVALFAI
ncbi:unnamed protein product [Ectocarpus fasciculatus]